MKRIRSPILKRHRFLSIITFTLLFAAFILFLLVALSLPIIKPVYLASLHAQVSPGQPATEVATELRFGVWGVCANSVLNAPTLFTNNGECTSPALGYTIPPALTELIGISASLTTAILKGLLILLVLHPVTAGLALVGFMFSLCLASKALSILALIVSIVSAILSSVVFAADLALVIVAKSQIKDITIGTFVVQWGNAVWLSLVGVILTWLAVIALSIRACDCCGLGRRYNEKHAREHDYNSSY